MDLSDQSLTIFIVDFGLAKRFHHPATGQHIPFHQVQCIRGTPAFISIHAHLGAELGHCNDLKSLAYMPIYLVCGSLPWLSKEGCQQVSSILDMKQKTAVEALCHHVPCELVKLTHRVSDHSRAIRQSDHQTHRLSDHSRLIRPSDHLTHRLSDNSIPVRPSDHQTTRLVFQSPV